MYVARVNALSVEESVAQSFKLTLMSVLFLRRVQKFGKQRKQATPLE